MAGTASQLTIGSLFSGIGGLELGLERAGLGPVLWQVEINPFARAVLEKHWPGVTRYEDVREVGSELAPVDVICGGFPCIDISNAGRREGIDGEHSGLWSEYARIVGLVRPRFVVVENVAALLVRGMERVLGDLAALGYDAEWRVLRASDVGAPHRRERIFVVAYRRERRREGERIADRKPGHEGAPRSDADGRCGAELANAEIAGLEGRQEGLPRRCGGQHVADSRGEAGRSAEGGAEPGNCAVQDRVGTPEPRRRGCDVANAEGGRRGARERLDREAGGEPGPGALGLWPPGPDDLLAWRKVPAEAQPSFCSLADGLPDDLVPRYPGRRPALEAYGNAVVPAVAEVVGRRLKEIADGRSLPIFGDGERAGGEG